MVSVKDEQRKININIVPLIRILCKCADRRRAALAERLKSNDPRTLLLATPKLLNFANKLLKSYLKLLKN